jgi:hypothetical protein
LSTKQWIKLEYCQAHIHVVGAEVKQQAGKKGAEGQHVHTQESSQWFWNGHHSEVSLAATTQCRLQPCTG